MIYTPLPMLEEAHLQNFIDCLHTNLSTKQLMAPTDNVTLKNQV